MAHALRLCVLKGKGHTAQASIKLPLRGLLFLYFSFLFDQEKNSEREGKAAPLSSVKALCMQRAALQVWCMCQGVPQAGRGTQGGRRELWRHLRAGRDGAGGCWDRTEAALASLLCPAVTFPDFFKLNYKYSVDNTERERKRGGK